MKSFIKMEIQQYLEKMKSIQVNLLQFLDDDENKEENRQNLFKLLEDPKILEDRHEFKALLNLIQKIINHHHRTSDFFSKIEAIFLLFKKEIKQTFSNIEIFNIFKNNKRILLFFIENGFIELNESIADKLLNKKHREWLSHYYFYPDVIPFLSKPFIRKVEKEFPENYQELKKKGVNHHQICEIIRSDSLQDFVSYSTENQINLNSTVKDSFFETNLFLLDNEPTLIEYAAFYGSIQIFQYLLNNKVEVTSSLWLYAIHSASLDLILTLGRVQFEIEELSYQKFLEEAIKCHHNELVIYIQTNFFTKSFEIYNADCNYNKNSLAYAFHYDNYVFFVNHYGHKFALFYACQYDYYKLVQLYLKSKTIDLGESIILKSIFL